MTRKLLISLLFILCQSAFAALNISLTLNEGSKVEGEYIEFYEDRWFYQESDHNTGRYILVFNDKLPNKFKMVNLRDVDDLEFNFVPGSSYKDHLKKNDIIFKNDLVSDSCTLTGNEGHHKHERMYGNFAWDIGIIKDGMQYANDGSLLEDYYIFGKELTSPLKGVVVGKVNDQEDNAPDLSFTSSLAGKVNNYLTIKVSENIYLSIVHFKKGTITVNVGDKIEVGQSLGLVGNSGVSYIPHIHYTLYAYIPEYNRFVSIPAFNKNHRSK